MARVSGKVAIVTGAARGLGAAQARALVAEGARVLMADVQAQAGRDLAAELGQAGVFVPLDVIDPAQWQAVVAQAPDRLGPGDVPVNNAGSGRRAPIDLH